MGRYHQKLEKLSHPQDRGFSEIFDDNGIASSVESVLIPLYSCVQVIQRENPNLITIPELIERPSRKSKFEDLGKIAGGVFGSALGQDSGGSGVGETLITIAAAIASSRAKKDDEIGSSLERSIKETGLEHYSVGFSIEDGVKNGRQVMVQAMDDKAFDLYCKCRQLIDVAKGNLKPEEEEVLNQIISRTEGESYRRRYDELVNPGNMNRNDDKEIKPLRLPDDYLFNPDYFDPSASVIGALSDKILNGGGQRFALMIELLASFSFGYIKPTIGNKRLLAARLSGGKLPTTYSKVEWIDKKGRSVSETEKVMLWLTNYLYGGGYDRAYEVLNFERHVKPGQETANLKNADKILRDRISLLYLNV